MADVLIPVPEEFVAEFSRQMLSYVVSAQMSSHEVDEVSRIRAGLPSEDRAMFDLVCLASARREFLSHLRYAKGHSPTTCYNYNSDLGIWGQWLIEADKDWQAVRYPDVEQFSAWLMRERGVKTSIVNRRLSALSTFYRWLVRNGVVASDPVALAEKPKSPLRMPVWLER